MWNSFGNFASRHPCVAAIALLLVSASPGTSFASADAPDFRLDPVPNHESARQPGGPAGKFQYVFGAPATWSGPLRWLYNHAFAPVQYADRKIVVIQQLITESAKWTAACGVQIVYDGETTSDPKPYVAASPDGLNVVGWQTPDIGISGATYSFYQQLTPNVFKLIDSDMVLDPVYVTSDQQLTRTVVHEWGHMIGLGHSNVESALMSGPPDSTYTNFTGLTADDIHGCRCLYGPPAGQHAGNSCSLPTEIDFGTLNIGISAIERQVAMNNDGDAALTILGVGTHGSEFHIGTNGCMPGTALAAGASCTFGVFAQLATTGDRADEVTIDTSEGPYRIPLDAKGIASPITPTTNFEGVWSNAPSGSESGWGINFAHQGDVIFATWFTYDTTGKAWWLTMTAPKTASNIYAGTLYTTRGPAFNAVPFDPSGVTYQVVGNGALTFSDANNGTFAYTVNGVTQTKAITRLIFGLLPVCTFGAQANLATATNYQDVWWAGAGTGEAGWGVNFTHQSDNIFATWFTYDFDGTPLWLSVTASRIAAGVYNGTLYRTTGPGFNAVPFDPQSVVRTPVGTLTLTFGDGNNATFAYTVTLGTPSISVTQTKQLTRLVFRAPGTLCE